jgi:transcription initiation factor IIF auxiliary subunit
MSTASDRAKAAVDVMNSAASDLLQKRQITADAQKAFEAANAEVDASIEALKTEKEGILATVNPA